MDKKNIEALYPLTPMQQALLFHSLRMGVPDPGLLHLRCTIQGTLDVATFAQAWQQVVHRHPALRTSVHWDALEQPLQVVHKQVTLAWSQEDWRALAPAAQQHRLDAFLQADHRHGLDLSAAPVMRLALLRTAGDVWRVVCSCHHVLLDGWSGALVLQEVLACYEALRQDRPPQLPPAPPFRDYVRWQQQQDDTAARTFWQALLAGFAHPTPLGVTPPDGRSASAAYDTDTISLSRSTTAALQAAAQAQHVTPSVLMQGAWALLLHHLSGMDDLVFGATVSGRSAALPGLASMVGVFINTLPVRVRIAPEATLPLLLQALLAQQTAAAQHEHVTAAQLHAWSEVPAPHRLFESILVVENYPALPAPRPGGDTLHVTGFEGGLTTDYPLTVAVLPGSCWTIRLAYDRQRIRSAVIARIREGLRYLLEGIAAGPSRRIADLLDGLSQRPPQAALGAHAPVPAISAAANGSAPARTRPFVPPRDVVELRLARIWEQVLHVHPIGVHDDFFALGGNSLAAARLFERIEAVCREKLPLALLFQRPTLAQLAAVLRGDGELPAWSSLVPLRAGGSRPPLFCVHSFGGHVFFYRALATHLPADQPVYGLQALGLDGRQPPQERVEEMAAGYIDEMLSLQPEGPYALLGMCLGGLIAFEIARQLHLRNRQVALLAVLDSGIAAPRRRPGPPGARKEQPGGRLGRLLRYTRQGLLRQKLDQYLFGQKRRLRNKTIGLKLKLRRTWTRRFGPPQQRTRARVEEALSLAAQRYAPEAPYPGRVVLLRSTQTARMPGKAWHLERWAELAGGGMTSYVLPGRHLQLLEEPHVRALAGRLQACLEVAFQEAETAAPAPPQPSPS